MKRILLVVLMVCTCALLFAQESEPVRETYDLQKVSKTIYKDNYYRLKNVVDSILYYSSLDSLNCVVIDNVMVKADGTTIHQVKSNSSNDEVNKNIEEALAKIKFPAMSLYDEDGSGTPVDVTALYSIVSNMHVDYFEYMLRVRGGEVTWETEIPEVQRGVLDKFAANAFYQDDSGKFVLKFSTFNINSALLSFGTFSLYKKGRKSEKLFIRYSGHQFTYFGKIFQKSKEIEAMEQKKREEHGGFRKAAFVGKDANAFAPWVSSRLVYPPYAKSWGITGDVGICFTVNKEGEVANVLVERAVHPVLDREAFQTISSSPKWTPAFYKGEFVKMSFFHPVMFRLR